MRLFFLLLFTVQSFIAFPQKSNDPLVVSGTVLLQGKDAVDHEKIIAALKKDWKVKPDSVNIIEKTLLFNVAGASVMMAQLDYATDPIEIRAASRLSWIWPGAEQEALRHQSQMVISVVGAADKSLELHQIFTKMAAAVLETQPALGVYMNSQYLLLSKGFYTAAAHNMLDHQSLPLYCWIYFGRPGEGGGYTFGMNEFGLPEMEIYQSEKSEPDVHSTLYDAAYSLVKYNTRLQDGQSVVTEEGQKIAVQRTLAAFLEGQTVLRLNY